MAKRRAPRYTVCGGCGKDWVYNYAIQQKPKCSQCSAAFVISRRGDAKTRGEQPAAEGGKPDTDYLHALEESLRKAAPEEAKEVAAKFPQYTTGEKAEEEDQPPSLRKATADLEAATTAQDRLATKVARLEDEIKKAKEDLVDKTVALQLANKQFQRATKEHERRTGGAQLAAQPASSSTCIPDSVLQNDHLDASIKAQIGEWNAHAQEFERKRREFFARLVGNERAEQPIAETLDSGGLLADSLLGQALSKQKESQSSQPPSSNASSVSSVAAPALPPKGTSWQDEAFDDEDADMPQAPALTEAEKKRKALTEAEESIVKRKLVGKQQPV